MTGHASPTLAQIARRAGVSVPTASRVANGGHLVAADTKARVQRAMEELGYVQRTRRDSRTSHPLVDIVLPQLTGAWVGEFLHGAQASVHRFGAQIVLSDLRTDDWCDALASRTTAGVVLGLAQPSQAKLDWLASRRIPTVCVAPDVPGPPFPAIVPGCRSGVRQAVAHLLALGHERIAVLAGCHTDAHTEDQLTGAEQAMEGAGLPLRAEYLRADVRDFDAAITAVHSLLNLDEPPTAVFAGSGELARGAVFAAAARGLVIPADLSIVGFGDLDTHQLPAHLTAVRLPLAEMADTAVGMLLDRGTFPLPRRSELPARLVVRGTTSAPPPRRAAHRLRRPVPLHVPASNTEKREMKA